MIEIKKNEGQNFEFSVKSETGKILLTSIPFTNKQSINDTVGSLPTTVSSAKNFERKTNFNGQFLFELKNQKGNIIGSSGLYSSEAGMENGIKNLSNRVQDQTGLKNNEL